MKNRIIACLIILSALLSGCSTLEKKEYAAFSSRGQKQDFEYIPALPSTVGKKTAITSDKAENPDPVINTAAADNSNDNSDTINDSEITDVVGISEITDSDDYSDPVDTAGPAEIIDMADNTVNSDTTDSSNTADNSNSTDTQDKEDKADKEDSNNNVDSGDDNKSSVSYTANGNSEDISGLINKKFEISEDVIEHAADYAPTASMSFAELVGDNGDYDLPEGFPEPDTYMIVVDKYYQLVMVFGKDDNGEYNVPVRFMLCSSGLSETPTRSGVFRLRSYRVRFALFNNTSVYGQYWSQVDGRMYFHSILYSEKKAESYTTSVNRLGNKASHGCIRLAVPDARWIWYNAAPGTIVIVRDGSSKDKVTKAIKEKITLAKTPDKRPASLTGDSVPYTDNWLIEDVPHDVGFVQGSQNNS